jgi:uncharacterized protein YlxP (DUF503 family)
MEVVHAAALRFELRIPESRSLKSKRAAVRPIIDGLRHQLRVSVAEVDHHDTWQRAALGVAAVAESDGRLREVLSTVERFVDRAAGVELLEVERAELVPPDAGLQEW